jgi:hypothetical protein
LVNLTPEEARNLASGILARIRLGGDPAAERTNARKAENVSELLKAFMDDHIRPKGQHVEARAQIPKSDRQYRPACRSGLAPFTVHGSAFAGDSRFAMGKC